MAANKALRQRLIADGLIDVCEYGHDATEDSLFTHLLHKRFFREYLKTRRGKAKQLDHVIEGLLEELQ
jgi:hypothetical protein